MKRRHSSGFGIHSLVPAIAVTGMSLILFLFLSVASAPSGSATQTASGPTTQTGY